MHVYSLSLGPLAWQHANLNMEKAVPPPVAMIVRKELGNTICMAEQSMVRSEPCMKRPSQHAPGI